MTLHIYMYSVYPFLMALEYLNLTIVVCLVAWDELLVETLLVLNLIYCVLFREI